MATRLGVAVLLLALLNACATPRVVRLDTGQGVPLEFRSSSSNKSVNVDAEAFEEALGQLVLDAPLALRAPHQDWLVRASHPGRHADSRWQLLMRKSFGGLCEPGQRRDHCLSLLDDGMGLGEWDKLGVALGLSLEPLKESIARAVEKTLAPQLFYAVIASSLVTWAVLAANPEPVFTKAAAIVAAVLLIYLGVETFLEVVNASRELKGASLLRWTNRAAMAEWSILPGLTQVRLDGPPGPRSRSMSMRNIKRASIEEIVQEYEQAAVAYGQALAAADHRSANHAHDRIAGAYRELRRRAAASHLLPLLRSADENVRSCVAAHALEFAPEHGEPVLMEFAARPGRLRTPAEYALKAWRKGTLKFP